MLFSWWSASSINQCYWLSLSKCLNHFCRNSQNSNCKFVVIDYSYTFHEVSFILQYRRPWWHGTLPVFLYIFKTRRFERQSGYPPTQYDVDPGKLIDFPIDSKNFNVCSSPCIDRMSSFTRLSLLMAKQQHTPPTTSSGSSSFTSYWKKKANLGMFFFNSLPSVSDFV